MADPRICECGNVCPDGYLFCDVCMNVQLPDSPIDHESEGEDSDWLNFETEMD